MHQCVSLSIRAVAVSSETYDPEFRNVPGIYTLELRGSAKVGNLGTLIFVRGGAWRAHHRILLQTSL